MTTRVRVPLATSADASATTRTPGSSWTRFWSRVPSCEMICQLLTTLTSRCCSGLAVSPWALQTSFHPPRACLLLAGCGMPASSVTTRSTRSCRSILPFLLSLSTRTSCSLAPSSFLSTKSVPLLPRLSRKPVVGTWASESVGESVGESVRSIIMQIGKGTPTAVR